MAANLLSSNSCALDLDEVMNEQLWQICDYGWLSNAARRPSNSTGTARPAVQSPDFEALLEGALSFDFALLDQETAASLSTTLFHI